MKLLSTLRILTCAFVLSSTQASLPVHADRQSPVVLYHGARLAVEERTSAGGDLVKLVVGGQAFLVSESDAPRQVVLRYLAQDDLSQGLSGLELQTITLAAVDQRDWEVLQASVIRGVTDVEAKEFDSGELWLRLTPDEEAAQVVASVIQGILNRALPERVCSVSAAAGGSTRGVAAVERLIESVARVCIEQAMVAALQGALNIYPLAQVIEELQRGSAPFLERVDPELNASVAEAKDAILALGRSVEEVEPNKFERALASLSERAAALGVQSSETNVRQLFIERAIVQRSFGTAITQLARIPFDSRSSRTHAQLISGLQGLSAADSDILLDQGVRSALMQYTGKDEEFYEQWIAAHTRLIPRLVEGGSLESAVRLAMSVQKESAEVAAAVVPLVVNSIVRGYLAQGDLAGAEEVVRQLMARPSVGTRVRMFVARQGASLPGALVALLALGFVGARYCKKRSLAIRDNSIRPEEVVQQNADTEQVTDSEDGSPSEICDEVPRASEFSSEYIAALHLFGLQPGATLAQIKNAYRSAVKQYHPDLKRGETTEDTTLFIRLTSEYERLLELHEREARNV